MRRLTVLSFLAVFAMAFTACQSATNTNVANTTRTNANANSNVAVVVPSNSNAAMNSTKPDANISRAEYDKDRAKYEAEKGTSTIGQGANDSWLWFKTRAALLATDDLRESTINVDVNNDVVTLRGTVANKAQSDKAASVAKGIEGVKSVTNQLKVQAGDSMTNQAVNGNTTKSNSNSK